jgi:glycosyltransferase involved in cell wall biosynthesis
MSSALRILHSYKVYRPDIDGGVPSAIATLCQTPKDEAENRILVARRKGFARRYDIDGVPVEAVASFGTALSTPLAPTFPFALLRHAKSSDIVVHHAPFPIADLAMPWLPAHVGLIVYWHADIAKYSFLKKLLTPAILKTLRRADRIIVADQRNIENSDTLAPFAYKCSVVPFGVDAAYMATCSAEEQSLSARLRQRYPRMILAIGRLVEYKGTAVLLDALKNVNGQVVLIGEGPLDGQLRRQAEQVAGKVTFAGRLSASECKSYLHAARVLAFPSISPAETFGIVQLEAMAAGLPIVNTMLDTAVPHIARDSREALTVAPNDPHALAAALTRILDDPVFAAQLGHNGRERVQAEYSQEKYVARVTAIYRDVAWRKHAPR